MDSRNRQPLALERQTGLPPGILYQPEHVGGSLGFAGPPDLESVWDALEAEAAAEAAAGVGPPGVGPNLTQTLNNFPFNATTVSQLVVPYNPARTYLMVQNKGAADVFLGFGRGADAISGFEVPAGPGFYEPILGTISSVHVVAAAGIQLCVFVEGFRA